MLIKMYGAAQKGKKRMCLITNAACPTKDPFEGTKDDQVSTIAMKMAAEGIKMESIVMRSNLTGDAYEKVIEENDHLLNLFSSNAIAKTVNVESPLSLLGSLKTRRVAPVTLFRGDLEINPTMKIKVAFFWLCLLLVFNVYGFHPTCCSWCYLILSSFKFV